MRSPFAVLLALSFSIGAYTSLEAQAGTQAQRSPASGNRSTSPYRSNISSGPAVPRALYQCEADQCTSPNGGGGAVWVFEGRRGQALWKFAAIASLTVEKFDGRTIVIHREDPNPSYSSPRFADLKKRVDGVFFADYVGTIRGNRVTGTVTWNGGGHGTWYASIHDDFCMQMSSCPISANQLLQLGQNSVHAKLYNVGYECFRIAALQKNFDGLGLAGLMMVKGLGTPANPSAGLALLNQSAIHGSYFGEDGLAQVYDRGIPGVPRSPELAAFWKKAAADEQQQEAAQAESQRRARQMAQQQQLNADLLVGGVIVGLILGAAVVADF
jgi:hypothetical protein